MLDSCSTCPLPLPSLRVLRGIALFPLNAEDPYRCDPAALRIREDLATLGLSDYTPKASRAFALHETYPHFERLELPLTESPDDATPGRTDSPACWLPR